MNEESRRHALSFGAAAALYDRSRPPYPREAVQWVLAACSSPPRRALDLGAGTGKLTRLLIEEGLEVVAVDPDAQMLVQLSAALPQVEVHVAPAEALPLPDGSVDVVLVGQAWHWVDPEPAAAEVSRVLRPGGVLGLLWNMRDEREDWVAAFGAAIESDADRVSAVDADQQPLGLARLGGPVQHRSFDHEVAMAPTELRELAASRSHLLTSSDADRGRMLDAVDELARTHPALAGRTRVGMPYRTLVWRATTPAAGQPDGDVRRSG